jgi:RimJ/RimL family protein N-acetyltransferase
MILPNATPRLRFAMPAPRHVPAYLAWCTSDRCAALGWATSENQAWRDFAGIIGHHALCGFGPFVAETPTGLPVGLFGAWHPLGQIEAEIKWTVWADDLEGKGIAAEAARAVMDHARDTWGWTTAVSFINTGNVRSAALARRLGAVLDGTWTTPSGKVVDRWRHDLQAVAT